MRRKNEAELIYGWSAVMCSFGSACVLGPHEDDLTNLSESVIRHGGCLVIVQSKE